MSEGWSIAGIISGIILMLVSMFMIGFGAGEKTARGQFQKQAIERGFAEYHPVTGEWQWKTDEGSLSSQREY